MGEQKLLEAASRAYCSAMHIDPDKVMLVTGSGALQAWEAVLPGLRAALDAIREPTDQMARAATASDPVDFDPGIPGYSEDLAKHSWRTMTEIVLEE